MVPRFAAETRSRIVICGDYERNSPQREPGTLGGANVQSNDRAAAFPSRPDACHVSLHRKVRVQLARGTMPGWDVLLHTARQLKNQGLNRAALSKHGQIVGWLKRQARVPSTAITPSPTGPRHAIFETTWCVVAQAPRCATRAKIFITGDVVAVEVLHGCVGRPVRFSGVPVSAAVISMAPLPAARVSLVTWPSWAPSHCTAD